MDNKYFETRKGSLEDKINNIATEKETINASYKPDVKLSTEKKYFENKPGSIEDLASKIVSEGMDPVNKDAVKKKFDDRKDKDIDNDGDVDSSDKFLHKRRAAVSKAIAKEALDSKDKPAVNKVIGQLKKAVAAHSGQVKDLEKAMKTESVNETHTTQTAKANAQQRAAGGEKSPISLMKNKSIDEITANNGKTFAQMRAEIDEACWDSHKQVGTKMKGGKRVPNCVPKNEDTSYPSKDDKIKGDNPADKGEKEQQAGEDTREPKKKTMSGKIATTPEMNPKVDYKY